MLSSPIIIEIIYMGHHGVYFFMIFENKKNQDMSSIQKVEISSGTWAVVRSSRVKSRHSDLLTVPIPFGLDSNNLTTSPLFLSLVGVQS